jgi:hypothetical protein
MFRFLLIASATALLAACQPAAAPSPTADAAAPSAVSSDGPPLPAQTKGWEVQGDPVLELTQVIGDQSITVACPEAKRQLQISFFPAWELDGPFDNAVIAIGDKSFDVSPDKTAPKQGPEASRPIYLLEANADTVTALMLGDNIALKLKDGSQDRTGKPDASGAFDMFATTCAQINGLR